MVFLLVPKVVHGPDRMVVELKLLTQSVHIFTGVVGPTFARGVAYIIM